MGQGTNSTTATLLKPDRTNNNAVLTFIGSGDLSGVELKVTKFPVPKDGVETIPVKYPANSNLKVYGGNRKQENMRIVFGVDDDLTNYLQVKSWLNTVKSRDTSEQAELYYDLSIVLYSNKNVKLFTIVYERALIEDLSGFDIITGQNQPIVKCEMECSFLKYSLLSNDFVRT